MTNDDHELCLKCGGPAIVSEGHNRPGTIDRQVTCSVCAETRTEVRVVEEPAEEQTLAVPLVDLAYLDSLEV